MRVLGIIIFAFFLISCEKNTEPVGGGEVYLESNQKIYSIGDTVEIYLINESNRSVYSFYPCAWGFSKYIDGEWKQLSIVLPDVIPIPVEHKYQKSIIGVQAFTDSGLYRYQQNIYWDKQRKFKEGIGMLISNEFEIKIGT
jgi:hypothetical protein